MEKEIFVAQSQGGAEQKGFTILNSDAELQLAFGKKNKVIDLSKPEQELRLPKDRKAVLYEFGTFRSGEHTPKGIDSVNIENQELIVYMKPEQRSKDDMMYQIMVMSNPWMIFSVPKNFEFNNVKITYSKP